MENLAYGLFAQTDVTGWVTAATSIGLLGPVLYWLCYHHLPAKDAQIKELIANKDAAVIKKDEQLEGLLKQMSEERERDRTLRHDMANGMQLTVRELFDRNAEAMAEQRSDFKKALEALGAQGDRRTVEIVAALHEELSKREKSRGTGV